MKLALAFFFFFLVKCCIFLAVLLNLVFPDGAKCCAEAKKKVGVPDTVLGCDEGGHAPLSH